MATFLFDSIVFGPVKSRRLGTSLGINLLPTNGKICSFDCVYCECGLNKDGKTASPHLPSQTEVKSALEAKLSEMTAKGEVPDVITFAGNGEPTLHPEFYSIIQDTVRLRNQYFPKAKVSVLSNAMHLQKQSVIDGLAMADNRILKLDSAVQQTFNTLNRPQKPTSTETIVELLASLPFSFILQTLFCKGSAEGIHFDNTTTDEVDKWLEAVKKTSPASVMIYTFSRDTPLDTLEKASNDFLQATANQVRSLNIPVELTLS